MLGALIGFEREWKARPAGLRTHIPICVAAATFGILTDTIEVKLGIAADKKEHADKDGPARKPHAKKDDAQDR